MILKNASFIGLFVLLAAAEPTCNPKATADNPLVGEWKWVKRSCCFKQPKITTPETCNCTKTLFIGADSTYSLLMPNGEYQNYTYTLRKGLDVMNDKDQTPLIVIGSEAPAIYTFNQDTLIISRGYIDLETDYYIPNKK